jgi:general secretion pathway protein F
VRAFSYIAFTGDGKRKTGTLVAETETDAARQLEAKGLFASEINARAGKTGTGRLRRRLDGDARAVFTRQMAVMMASEMTAEAALDVVLQSEGGPRLNGFATGVKAALMDGHGLANAIDDAGAGFERYYVSALRAGEASGDLAGVFEQLALFLERRDAGRAEIAAALTYPAFVLTVSVLVCGVLMTNVAPEIASIFESTGQPLPVLTRVMMALTGWITANWLWLIVGFALFVALVMLALRRPASRARIDGALLRLPVVGRLMRLGAAAQYLRTLALVLASRQTVPDAARSAAEVLPIARFRAEAEGVSVAVTEGQRLSRALSGLSCLPPVARQLVEAGERSSELARMTDRAAVLAETWTQDLRRRIAAVLDPLLMIVVGVFVLTVVLSILLPIFDLQAGLN